MKQNYFETRWQVNKWLAVGLLLFGMSSVSEAQSCDAPTGLEGKPDGYKVTLSWNSAPRGTVLLENGFEDAEFPPQGWEVKGKNPLYDYPFSWFLFPTQDFIDMGMEAEEYVHGGENAACIYMDPGGHPDGSIATQDEWLITPELDGAVYLDFYSLIDEHVLEYGADPTFPDHYYVKASHDDGKTWEVLWDARYHSFGTSDWELISLKVGEPGMKTKIAFEAAGNQNSGGGLYFMWIIDDICISNGIATTNGTPRKQALRVMEQSKRAVNGKETPSYRAFEPKSKVKSAPAAKTKAAFADIYNIYRGDSLFVENWGGNSFVDFEEKKPGDHKYAVTVYCEDCDLESEQTAVNVHINEFLCAAPTNLRSTVEAQPDSPWGGYRVCIYWDDAVSDRTPIGYNCYVNTSLRGMYMPNGVEGFGNVGVEEGFYEYSVTAVYEYPDGESEHAKLDIATSNTRYPVNLITLTQEGDAARIEWTAPKETNGYTIEGYNLYCADKLLLGKTTETSYLDTNVPAGIYDYTVRVLYTDGVESIGKSVTIENGEMPVYDIADGTFFEDFKEALKPANWQVVNDNERDSLAGVWWFEDIENTTIDQTGSNMRNGVALHDCRKYGNGNGQKSLLITPPITCTSSSKDIVYLDFDFDYLTHDEMTEVTLWVSIDMGKNWERLETLEGYIVESGDDFISAPEHMQVDVDHYVRGNKTAMFRWSMNNMSGFRSGYIAIDNVNIGTELVNGITSINTYGINVTVDGERNLVVNTTNQVVRSVAVMSVAGVDLLEANTNTLSAASLPTGVYLVRVTTDKGTCLKKIVLN